MGVVPTGSGVALAAGSSGVGPAVFGPQASGIKDLTRAVQITRDDPVPTRTFSGPYMLADPDNPKIIVAATAELRSRVCYLARSVDAGVTWHVLSALPALNAYPFCSQVNGGVTEAPLAWGRNHTLYYALAGYDVQDGGAARAGNASVLLARSSDLGDSWSTTIVDNTRGRTGAAITFDGPVASVAVDTAGSQDVVYVGFRQSHPKVKSSDSNSMVAASSDGGRTFSPAVNLNQFDHLRFPGTDGKSYPSVMTTPIVSAAANGTVVAFSGTFLTSSAPKSAGRPDLPMVVARSTDHGRTFTVSATGPPGHAIRGPGVAWSSQGGSQGTFLAVYQQQLDVAQGSSDIVFQRSTDGARTWSSPVRLNDDNPAAQYTHYLPQIDVAPNGRVDVVWYDFRLAHGFSPDVYYTYSTDGGATWAANRRVTDRSIDLNFGVSANSDVRQPPGVASANQVAVFGWADTRQANPATQTQDVYGDVAQFAPLPAPGTSVVVYLAAIFGGIVAAGLIFLVIVLSRRRRQDVPPPPTIQARQPVDAV